MQSDHLNISYENQQHDDISFDFEISENLTLKNFRVYKGVFKPNGIAAQRFARFLSENSTLYLNKNVLDLGCGTGLQGIIMGICGANKVTFSDVSLNAIKNTSENIKNFNIAGKSKTIVSDLFSEINEKFDLIVFNHPYFDEPAMADNSISRSITDSGELLKRFLNEARNYLNNGGKIIMPYLPIAGEVNDPQNRGKEYKYSINILFSSYLEKPDKEKLLFNIYQLN